MEIVQQLLSGAINLVSANVTPDKQQVIEAVGLDPNVGQFQKIGAGAKSFLADGCHQASGWRISVVNSFSERPAVILSITGSVRQDKLDIAMLAPDARVVESTSGLGRAIVFERYGLQCAITVSAATGEVDGVICEAPNGI